MKLLPVSPGPWQHSGQNVFPSKWTLFEHLQEHHWHYFPNSYMFILYRCNRKSNWNPVRPLSWGFSRSERAPAVQRRVQAGRTLSCQDQWRRPQHNETNSEKPSDSISSPNAASFTSFIQIRGTNRNKHFGSRLNPEKTRYQASF